MSERYPGGFITKNYVAPTPTSAPGIWTLDQQEQAKQAGIWPFGGPFNYIEDVFSTYLYTGNGSTQTINNGIDLAGKGGLTWIKYRGAYVHILTDTARGVSTYLDSSAASGNGYTTPYGLTSFNANGFSLKDDSPGNYGVNGNGSTYASWTFRKQPKFFDVVTYTGTGSNRTIAHNLGSTPGCIIVKRTDTTGNWQVYHNGLTSAAYSIQLNSTAAQASATTVWNSTAPTSTVFSVGTDATVNASGGTYVAYIFAHNAGGFGLTGTDNVISCGSFTTDGSGNATVSLGYEPQYLMFKAASGSYPVDAWYVNDTMRGFSQTNTQILSANTSSSESATGTQWFKPNATGFSTQATGAGAPTTTYIYIAIRRGPMKVPTTGTSVFTPILDSSSQGTTLTTNFPVDAQIIGYNTTTGYYKQVNDRLRGAPSPNATTPSEPYSIIDTSAEANDATRAQSWDNVSYQVPSYYASVSTIYYNFRRAPSFFDEVCYTGTGTSGTAIPHNLGVAPELIISKARSTTNNWLVWATALGNQTSGLLLNTTDAVQTIWASGSSPTSSNVYINYNVAGNSGVTYVSYLFATCAGVSKVGTYTGNGSTQAIACGFAGGARFVLIKRTDSTGGWYVYDTARGMTTLTDPYLLLNSPAAETATLGSVTTTTGGFTVNASILSAINTSSATYIFLAVA